MWEDNIEFGFETKRDREESKERNEIELDVKWGSDRYIKALRMLEGMIRRGMKVVIRKENQIVMIGYEKIDDFLLKTVDFKFVKDEKEKIFAEVKKGLEISKRMHVEDFNVEVMKYIREEINTLNVKTEEIYINQVCDSKDFNLMGMLMIFFPDLTINIKWNDIDFQKLDKRIGFKNVRVFAAQGIGKLADFFNSDISFKFKYLILESSSFKLMNDKKHIWFYYPKIMHIEKALLYKESTEEKISLIDQLLLNWKLKSTYSFNLQIDSDCIRYFENLELKKDLELSTFQNLRYLRLITSDLLSYDFNSEWIQQNLEKLKIVNSVDVIIHKSNPSNWFENKSFWDQLFKLNIRKLSLIQIKVRSIKKFEYFIRWLSNIQTLKEIKYSFHRYSEIKWIDNIFEEKVKLSNFTFKGINFF